MYYWHRKFHGFTECWHFTSEFTFWEKVSSKHGSFRIPGGKQEWVRYEIDKCCHCGKIRSNLLRPQYGLEEVREEGKQETEVT